MPPRQLIKENSKDATTSAPLGMIMIYCRFRTVYHPISMFPESTTPVDILHVHKESIIHRSDTQCRNSIHKHRRTSNPIHCFWNTMIIISHHKPIKMFFPEWQTTQPSTAIQYRLGSIIMETAQLKCSIKINLFRTNQFCLRMRLHVAYQCRNGFLVDKDIAIDEKNVFPTRFGQRNIKECFFFFLKPTLATKGKNLA